MGSVGACRCLGIGSRWGQFRLVGLLQLLQPFFVLRLGLIPHVGEIERSNFFELSFQPGGFRFLGHIASSLDSVDPR